MTVGEFVSPLFLLICRSTNCIFTEMIFVIQLFFKDFVSTFLNFLRVPVYLGHTLLYGCFQDVANKQDKNVAWKFVLRKATYFCLLFFGKICFAPYFSFCCFFVLFLFCFFGFFLFFSDFSLYLDWWFCNSFLKRFICTFHVFCYISVKDFLKRFICTFHVFCYIFLMVLIVLRWK